MLTQKKLIILIILLKTKVNNYCVDVNVTQPPDPKIASVEYSTTITQLPISKIELKIETKAEQYIIMKDCAMYLDKHWIWGDQDSKGQKVDLDFTRKLERKNDMHNDCGKGIRKCFFDPTNDIFMVYVYLKSGIFNVCTLASKTIQELIEINKPSREFSNDMDFVDEYLKNYDHSALDTVCKDKHKEFRQNTHFKKDKDFLEKMGTIMVNYCVEEATNFISHLPVDNNTSDTTFDKSCSSWSEAYRALGLLII